jgi:hypothetical protein
MRSRSGRIGRPGKDGDEKRLLLVEPVFGDLRHAAFAGGDWRSTADRQPQRLDMRGAVPRISQDLVSSAPPRGAAPGAVADVDQRHAAWRWPEDLYVRHTAWRTSERFERATLKILSIGRPGRPPRILPEKQGISTEMPGLDGDSGLRIGRDSDSPASHPSRVNTAGYRGKSTAVSAKGALKRRAQPSWH